MTVYMLGLFLGFRSLNFTIFGGLGKSGHFLGIGNLQVFLGDHFQN